MNSERQDSSEGAQNGTLEEPEHDALRNGIDTPSPPIGTFDHGTPPAIAAPLLSLEPRLVTPAEPIAGPSDSSARAPSPQKTEIGIGDASGVQARATGHAVLAMGSHFGVYVVGTCIGEGGMARVYQAEHAGLRRQVALKVLMHEFANDPEGRERFVREARIAAAIKHPNVVNIFDVGVHEKLPYLVMELLEGTDLEAMVATRGALDEGLILDIMVPVVAGLSAVHDAGIVHRDLKPGNIFLSKGRYDDLEPKLLDFGISKACDPDQMRITNRSSLMGTPFYMSPEGVSGAELTPLSDQYSLAVVMYECATGHPPYKDVTLHELVQMISRGEYPAPDERNPRVSKRLARIITRAMDRDPARRYPDLRAMGRELLSLAGQRTQITWGLTFDNPRARTMVSNRTTAPVVIAPVDRPRRSPWVRGLPVALVVLGALVPVLAFGPSVSKGGGSSGPSIERRAGSAAPQPAATGPAGLLAPMRTLAIEARSDSAKSPPVRSPSLAPSNPPPADSRASAVTPVGRATGRSNRAGRPAKSPPDGQRRAALAAPEPVPEWSRPIPSPAGPQAKMRDARTVGNSNGAPIFD